jgi:trans-aconitate methyltransferase
MSHQWNAARYDSEQAFVYHYGEDVLKLLAPRAGERILDLGCGTGHLTARIAEAGAEAIGLDSSPDMIEQARKNYPGLHFVLANAADFHFDQPFDAVFSNAALHWIKQPAQVAASVWAALKVRGRFVAEFGGKGNLKAFILALNQAVTSLGYPLESDFNPWYFPGLAEYVNLLEQQGFTVTFAALFDRPTKLDEGERGLHNWIKMFADDFLADVPKDQHAAVIHHVEDQLRPDQFHDEAWWADYKRLRIVAVKE